MAMSDGVQVGATLDRNGLRPSRYYVTSDDKVILASEVGVLEGIEPANVIKKAASNQVACSSSIWKKVALSTTKN